MTRALGKNLAFILLLGTSFVLVLSQSAAYAQPEEQVWLTYEDALVGLKVDYPANWERNDEENGLLFTPPDAESTLAGFSLSKVNDYLEVFTSAKDYIQTKIQLDREQQDALWQEIEVLDANTTTLGGLPAERADVGYTMWGGGEFTEVFVVAINEETNDIYVVTYMGHSSEWDRYEPSYERMLQSVEVIQ
jgi:hypothetical protein